jgi:hypothetical protein
MLVFIIALATVIYTITVNWKMTALLTLAIAYVLRQLPFLERFSVIDKEWYPPNGLDDPRVEGGDLHLTNLYRRLHQLDGAQRSEVFQFNDALAGGNYNISREQYTGQMFDREMNTIRAHIIDDIASQRVDCPTNQLYDVPSKPLFVPDGHHTDHRILGVPSQVGSLPYYY